MLDVRSTSKHKQPLGWGSDPRSDRQRQSGVVTLLLLRAGHDPTRGVRYAIAPAVMHSASAARATRPLSSLRHGQRTVVPTVSTNDQQTSVCPSMPLETRDPSRAVSLHASLCSCTRRCLLLLPHRLGTAWPVAPGRAQLANKPSLACLPRRSQHSRWSRGSVAARRASPRPATAISDCFERLL